MFRCNYLGCYRDRVCGCFLCLGRLLLPEDWLTFCESDDFLPGNKHAEHLAAGRWHTHTCEEESPHWGAWPLWPGRHPHRPIDRWGSMGWSAGVIADADAQFICAHKAPTSISRAMKVDGERSLNGDCENNRVWTWAAEDKKAPAAMYANSEKARREKIDQRHINNHRSVHRSRDVVRKNVNNFAKSNFTKRNGQRFLF